MIDIQLENGRRIPLHGKSVLVIPPESREPEVITDDENEWGVIVIVGGIDRKVNLELHAPAIVILSNSVRTQVNVTGGMALPISQVVFVGGVDNVAKGIETQNRGRIIQRDDQEFDIGVISEFSQIEISR